MIEIILGFLVLFVLAQLPLFIGGFVLDFMFKERHKHRIEKLYGGEYNNWGKFISPIYGHPQWPIIVHILVILMYIVLIFYFNVHWVIFTSYILTYYNEDIYYYIGKKIFYFEYLPEKLPWLRTFMPIKSIRENGVLKSSFIEYSKVTNLVNFAVLLVFFLFLI